MSQRTLAARHIDAIPAGRDHAAGHGVMHDVDGLRGPYPQTFAGDLAFGDRPGIERAHLALQLDRRALEIELRLRLVQLVRIGHAVVRLRHGGRHVSRAQALQTLGEHVRTQRG